MNWQILVTGVTQFSKNGLTVVSRCLNVVFILSLVLLWSPLTLAAGVQALFNLETPTGGPFPSNLFTVADPSHNTGRRVNLPFPNCAERPSDCNNLAVINTLDGFNVQPRLSIPFSGPIDVNTVTSETVFLVSLGSTLPGGDPGGQLIGINQVVWDPATNTLHAESDEFLDQHTRYALIVTNGVRDPAGDPVEVSETFKRFRHDLNFGQTKNPALKAYRKALLEALAAAGAAGVGHHDIVAASVFTTQSVTAILEKIRDQLKADIPEPADFLLGPGGTRTVFPLSNVMGITFNRQVGTAPSFSASAVPISALGVVPGAVGQLAFGKYLSPNYEKIPEGFIPPVGTLSGTPEVQSMNEVFFNLFLPSSLKPPGGWPVAIFGHGASFTKNDGAFMVAATMAAQGIATVVINAVGQGGGLLGTLTVNQTRGPVTFPAGGRGIDQDGNGTIGSTEGLGAAPPRGIISLRDGFQQTVVDLMQLVREIEVGIDVNGDGVPDLDASRIYYSGISLGAIYGTMFLAVEPSVRAGVPHVPGGPFIELLRLSPFTRPVLGFLLASRVPSLINGGGITFNENMPLRNQPPVINTVPGAIAIQELFEKTEWVQQPGNPVAYAPHLRKQPLDGVPAKSVIIQFAKGDQFAPNPTTTAMLRAGDLADRATFYRHDLAFADPLRNPNPPGTAVPKDPHGFQLFPFFFPAVADIGLAAQQQVAEFFASDGETVIDPDGPGPLFEVPIVGPLPEELNFIP